MIIDYDELKRIREIPEKKISLFKGTFDLFHYDHLMLLAEIKEQCDILVVEVKSDADVKNNKGEGRPIIDENRRAAIVDNIKFTDYTIIANKKKKTELINSLISNNLYTEKEVSKLLRDGYLIEQLCPDYVYTTDEKPVPSEIKDLCNELEIEIKIVKMKSGLHTTDIINKCKAL